MTGTVETTKIAMLVVAGIVLVVLGVLINVITYTMLPIQLQSQADLQCSTTSGVTLSTSTDNLITNMSNLQVLILLLVGPIVLIAGIILIFIGAFKFKNGM